MRKPTSRKERAEHLFKVVTSQRFLAKQGLGNEVPFFICPYRLKDDGGFNFEPGRYEEKAKPKTDPSRSESQTARAYQDSTHTRFVSSGSQPFPTGMTAEGYRKIGVLHRLLSNGSINPGQTGVLLWDEPEANLNPKLMKEVVQVLLELSRNGQQIVVATHDYVLLKWLDLLMDKKGKEDHVRYHVLQRREKDRKMSVYSTDDYGHRRIRPADK